MVNPKYKYRGFRHKYGGVRRDEKKKEILNPADIAWYADYFRTYPMGFQPIAEMGVIMGEVAYPLFDSPFLRSYALLRRFLRPDAL